jgi:hypothetical protein
VFLSFSEEAAINGVRVLALEGETVLAQELKSFLDRYNAHHC